MNPTIKRYASAAVNILTRPFSRKVQLYSSPAYIQAQKDKKNPKSPRYQKSWLDNLSDNVLSR